ncbi:LolA family protein [Kitasatospora sp. NBC_01539]|uniref:LolA family protein n=1 Tax=Kitasatospora sp. NBC_01539 TaxID=2903577 RepID=UPI00386020D5
MAEQGTQTTEQGLPGAEEPQRSGRRTAVRVAVPVAVAAAVAAGIGLVPALADGPGPKLPAVSAEQLVAKVLGADTQALSGTVQVKVDLGLPSALLGAAGDALAAGPGAGGGSAGPEAELASLLGGQHAVQVAVDGPDRQRITLAEGRGGYELVHDGAELWAWDGASNEAVHLTDPQGAGRGGSALPSAAAVTPQEAAKRFLRFADGTTTVAVDGTTRVAGRDAYRLSLVPKGQGSTVARVRIAVDAERGVPLGVQVTATSGGTVLDTHFSRLAYGAPAASTFRFTPPKGAKVTERPAGGDHAAADAKALGGPLGSGTAPDPQVTGEGWQTVVSSRLPDGLPSAPGGPAGRKAAVDGLQPLVKMIGKPVGGGTLVSTKLLNVLVTDDGRVFAGAVTLPVLQSAAGVKG